MPFHPDLTEKIFALPPKGITTNEDEKALNAFLTTLYGQAPNYEYCHPKDPTSDDGLYNQQIEKILEKYIDLAEKLQIKPGDIESIKRYLHKWRTAKTPYLEQTQDYYNNIKRLFERCYFLLCNLSSHSTERVRGELKFLCRQLDECSTGIYGALESIQEQLISPQTIPHYLESTRNFIIEQYASQFFHHYKTNKVQQGLKATTIDRFYAHAIQIFHTESFKAGFTSFKGLSHQHKKDAFQDYLDINQREIRRLRYRLKKQYTPEVIVKGIKDQLLLLLTSFKDRNLYADEGNELVPQLEKLFKPFIQANILTIDDILVERNGGYYLALNVSEHLDKWIDALLLTDGYFKDRALQPVRELYHRETVKSAKAPIQLLARELQHVDSLRKASRKEKVQLSFQLIKQALSAELLSQGDFRKWLKKTFSWFSFLFKTSNERKLSSLHRAITQHTQTNELSDIVINDTSAKFYDSLYQLKQLSTYPIAKLSDTETNRLRRFEDQCQKGRISKANHLFEKPCVLIHNIVKLDDEFFDTKFTTIFSYLTLDNLGEQVSTLNEFIQNSAPKEKEAVHEQIQKALEYLAQGGSPQYLALYRKIPLRLRQQDGLLKKLTHSVQSGECTRAQIDTAIAAWQDYKGESPPVNPVLALFLNEDDRATSVSTTACTKP